jgi:P4 family phage/plasmid primase-like protien
MRVGALVKDFSSFDPLSGSRFIRELWGIAPDNWLGEFTFLQKRPTQEDPDGERCRWVHYTVGEILKDYETFEQELNRHNREQVENILHGVNPRFQKPKKRGKNKDVDGFVALWADVDWHGGPDEEKDVREECAEFIAELTEKGLPPSVVIESGWGLHFYWLLDKVYPVKAARPHCAGLQKHFKIADPINDQSRCLRVPGFINLRQPKMPKMCRILEATYQRFPLEAFKDFSAEVAISKEDQEEEKAQQESFTLSADPEIEELKKGVGKGDGPKGGRHNSAVSLAGHYCSRLKTKNLVMYAMREWNEKNSPPLPEEEIKTIVTDIWMKEQVKRQEVAAFAEDKPKKKKKGPPPALAAQPWFDDEGNFNPAIMAAWFMQKYHFFSTPIANNGLGVTLSRYDKGAYRPTGLAFLNKECCKLLAAEGRSKRLNEVTDLVNRYATRPYEEINPHAMDLVNVKNGMLNWKTGELLEHDPKYLSTVQINAEYDPNAKCPELDKFFGEIFPPDALELVEEFTGHLMVPDTSFEKCFIAVGEGGNGKSTFLKLLRSFLSPENVSTVSLHKLVGKDKFFLAQLAGKLANIYHDLDSSILEATDAFKLVTSGDPVLAEQKYQPAYTFVPFARLVFSANQFPRVNDKSEAFPDRLLFVPFPNRIRNSDKQIRKFDEVLMAKPGFMSAFLNKAVAGLRRLMGRNRFTVPEISRQILENYRRECNSAYDFIRDVCALEPNGWIQKKTLYQKYVGWCQEVGVRQMAKKHFNKTVETTQPGIRMAVRDGYDGWAGLTWANGEPRTPDDEVADFGSSQKTLSDENTF